MTILYSFRRCPYAIRARMALHASCVEYELREVDLKNKPDHMLAVSPKGSVPVLILPNRHGASSTPEHESACAGRFPHPILPPVVEGENESLRDFYGNGHVIDESFDIMQWALRQHDSENWLGCQDEYLPAAQSLVAVNDTSFKQALDGYKYADS